MADNELDVLIKFITDEASKQKAGVSAEQVAKQLERIADSQKKVFEAFKQFSVGKITQDEFQKIIVSAKKVEEATDSMVGKLRTEAKILRAEAAAITDDLAKARIQALKTIESQIGGVSKTLLGIGVGVTGGIFGFANKYVNDAKEATAVTIAWKQAQEDLRKSGERVGATLAETALPLLQRVATLADEASRFFASHPEIARTALNIGIGASVVGAAGIIVSKIVGFIATLQNLATLPQQLAAARLQDLAADKQLAAARLRLGQIEGAGALKTGGAAAAGGGVASTIGIVAGTAVASLGLTTIISGELDKLEKVVNEKFTGIGTFIHRILSQAISIIPGTGPFLPAIENLKKIFPQLQNLSDKYIGGFIDKMTGAGDESQKAADGVDKFAQSIAGIDPATLEKAAQDLENFQAESLAAEQKYNDDRMKIITDSNAAAESVSRQSGERLAQIAEQARNQIEQARIQAAQADAQATAQYISQREEIIKSGNEDIARIEVDTQKQLEKQAEEHNRRVSDLAAARDALGLAKENRDFAKQQAETRKDAQAEVAQRRREIQQRLADLQAGYEQERAQRAADLAARIVEIQAQAEAERKEQIAAASAEMERIQQDRANKLRELDATYRAEQQHRYQAFIGQLRELDAHLLGEYDLQQRRHQEMLTDLDDFLIKYKAGLSSLGTAIPARAAGGYAAGLVSTGEQGYEYVLSHSTTRAAENIIGGRLTQDALLARLMNSGGHTSIMWNDQRRFDGAYTNEIRRANRADTLQILKEALT